MFTIKRFIVWQFFCKSVATIWPVPQKSVCYSKVSAI